MLTKMKRVLLVTMLCLAAIVQVVAQGNNDVAPDSEGVFVATTPQGLAMKFRITDEEAKTVEVYGNYGTDESGPAIDAETEGSVIIPNHIEGYTVTGISSWAFRNCQKITSVSIPDGVTYIGASAFRTCYGLEDINIPEGVTRIEDRAFYGIKVQNITLPSTLQSLGEDAVFRFGDVENPIVTVAARVPITIGEWSFYHKDEITLRVPEGCKAAYEAADYWNQFKAIEEYETPGVYRYIVNEVCDGNIMRSTSGKGIEGDEIIVPYRRYNVHNENLYIRWPSGGPKGKEYNHYFTLSTENQTETLGYDKQETAGPVVFLKEAEDIAGMIPCTIENAYLRSSNAAAAYPQYGNVEITRLPAGVYRLTAVLFDSYKTPDEHWKFLAGSQEIADFHNTVVNFEELTSDEFTITEETPIYVVQGGNERYGVDLVYIVKVGEYVPSLPTYYSLNIIVSGNGNVTYNNSNIRGRTQTFTITEGASATMTLTPDDGYRIKNVKVNNADVTSQVSNGQITINNIMQDTNVEVAFEVIPPTTYILSVTASGNGYVAYDGNTVRGKTSSFTVVKGTNIILTFSPDEGSRLKSVKVNGQDITSTIINDKYIKNVTADINIEVAFEAIPSYSLNIVASGNGNAVYNGTTIRNQSFSFTLQEGSTAVVSLTPDTGYRIKSVKVNNTDRTSQMSNGQITISSIDKDTNVEVSFEEIPPTTYGLTIAAIGNGSVTYDGKTIRSGSSLFTIVEGSYVTVQIAADAGYRLKSVVLSGKDVTADVANNQYTTTKIVANTTLKVEFEAIPSFSLTIKSSAFGSVKYGDAVITNGTETFTVREGAQAVLTFMADGNGRLQRITLNGADITQELKNWQYTISNIGSAQSVEAEYIEDFNKVTFAGVAYTVTSYDEGTVIVASGNYGLTLTVPATFEAKGKTWTVTGIDNDALVNATELAAIIWKPEVQFSGEVSNPNLLLYVNRADYAPSNIQNVVEGNEDEGEALQADNIVLAEAESGNNFYCPIAFTARRISYKHNYSMISGYNVCQGWETLVLPFDVSMIVNAKGTELVPYTSWRQGSSLRPFWLYQMTESGWQAGNGIKANVPYIISIPNNELYQSSYNVAGNIQFIGNNVEVKASDDMTTGRNGNKRFVANYQNKAANSDIYALNVNNLWCHNAEADREGSVFVSESRPVHPFEAYMTIEGSNAPRTISVFDNGVPTNIVEIERMRNVGNEEWYDLQGRKLQGEPTKSGVYINRGRKIKK